MRQRTELPLLDNVGAFVGRTVKAIAGVHENDDYERDAQLIAFTDGTYAFGSFSAHGFEPRDSDELLEAELAARKKSDALDEAQAQDTKDWAEYHRLKAKFERD